MLGTTRLIVIISAISTSDTESRMLIEQSDTRSTCTDGEIDASSAGIIALSDLIHHLDRVGARLSLDEKELDPLSVVRCSRGNIQVPEPRGVLSTGLRIHLVAVFDPADPRLSCDWGDSNRPTNAVFMPPLGSKRCPLSVGLQL